MPAGAHSLEIPLTFGCAGATLVGILHRPARAKARGVVIVVGAPQYRAGSHRQFVLLARDLAAAGYPVLRFDYRGMGDSGGDFAGFEGVNEDIRAAIDCLFDRVEGLRDVVLWGLCDGASAAAFYGSGDTRLAGLVLLNPWVRSEASLARTRLAGYYLGRLMSRDFWGKVVRREVDVGGSVGDLGGTVSTAVTAARAAAPGLPRRVADALRRLKVPILLILSGNDLTAREFEGAVLNTRSMRRWSRRSNVTLKRIQGANHTYSEEGWRRNVHDWTIEWLAGGPLPGQECPTRGPREGRGRSPSPSRSAR